MALALECQHSLANDPQSKPKSTKSLSVRLVTFLSVVYIQKGEYGKSFFPEAVAGVKGASPPFA